VSTVRPPPTIAMSEDQPEEARRRSEEYLDGDHEE
jgi:hypothetical protein